MMYVKSVQENEASPKMLFILLLVVGEYIFQHQCTCSEDVKDKLLSKEIPIICFGNNELYSNNTKYRTLLVLI